MFSHRRLLVICLVHLLALGGAAGVALAQNSSAASRAEAERVAQEGIRLVEAKKPKEGLAQLEKALAVDPQSHLALFWKSLAQVDLGQVDEALATLDELLAASEKTEVSNITIEGCVNAGLILVQLKEERRANLWFTRAIMLDPADKHRLHWKAYRNMAISHHNREQYLSATMCAISGVLADPRRVSPRMVDEFLAKVDEQEVAQILTFSDQPVKAERRAEKGALAPATALQFPAEVVQVGIDAPGNRLVVFCRNEQRFHVVECGRENAVRAHATSDQPLAFSLVQGELYLSLANTGIVQVDLSTGEVKQTWKLAKPPVHLAVLPEQRAAFFPQEGLLTTLDLETGKTLRSDYFSDTVAADPLGKFIYSFKRSEARPEIGHVIINGRPVLLQRAQADWIQTALFKFAVADKQPVLAEVRMNAASNGRALRVSPDGRWVAVVGGGGWRPHADGGHGAGYGVALVAAADFTHVQGFYPTEGYPLGLAVNGVTGQVVALRDADARVFDVVRDGKGELLEGAAAPQNGIAAWSADGRQLFIASGDKLRVWTNHVAEAELKQAEGWRMSVPQLKAERAAAVDVVEPLAEYGDFEVKNERAATEAAISLALREGRLEPAREWLEYADYQRDKSLSAALVPFVNKLDREGAGIRIYQLKKLDKEHPDHPGVDFLLAMSYFASGQLEEAEKLHVTVVQTDRGRTNLSTEALRCLAEIAQRGERPQAAAYCMAHLLRLDNGNRTRLAEAATFFKKAELTEAAQPLLERGRRGASDPSSKVELPVLPSVDPQDRLTSEALYAAAAQSVVLIRTATGSGSGVCVAEKGIIVTNAHVVGREADALRVYPYTQKDDKLERGEALAAEVLYHSEEEDIAVLRVKDPPASLVPLAVASKGAAAGAHVYALGNPGLGEEVLEQSITEGIVSSAARRLDGKVFLQHTAAVNPGNSGGPLLNDHGQVVGVVTARAELENVGFAIPAERLRDIFRKP